MELEDLIRSIKATRSIPTEEDKRSLPYKKAFVYGRVSSQGQVKDSRESIREVAKLVVLAKKDGYISDIEPEYVEQWLESIQNGEDVSRFIESGDIVIDCRDLGLSGSLGQDKRPGLKELWRRVESGETGSVYLTEGMSRLSRDRDRVLGYRLLRLLKEQQCRVRTPEGIYSPAVSRDWDNLADDIDESAEEMKKMGSRLGRRRISKASEGRHVGSPVCPGFIVEIEGLKRDGSYIMGKWKPYPPHQEIVILILKELIKQGSIHKTAQSLSAQGIVFPFFTPEFSYMETRSVLRQYRRDNRGYLISSSSIKGLAMNLNLIGMWIWMDIVIENNHPAIVSTDLFLQSFEAAMTKQPRGRAAYSEPMVWADLLYCYNHEEPRKLAAHNTLNRWACTRDFQAGLESRCLYIADHILTPPLTKEFLRCLDLTPHARQVLDKLRDEESNFSLEEARRHRQETELKTRLSNMEKYLGTADAEQEETYWRLIKETKVQLQLLQKKPSGPRTSLADIEKVAEFLENLEYNWERYPSQVRNHLLKLLIERVEIRHDLTRVEAIVIWKNGFTQKIHIDRPTAHFTKDTRWSKEEDNLLKMLWPTAPWEALLGALPNRTAESINQRASRLKIKRQSEKKQPDRLNQWTPEEETCIRNLYSSGVSAKEIAEKLARTERAVRARLCILGIHRPKGFYPRKHEVSWISEDIKVTQGLTTLHH